MRKPAFDKGSVQNHVEAVRRLSRFEDRCQIHRETSAQAVKTFLDGSLDFVYLDGRHYRTGIEEDLSLWSPKVRPGGILRGFVYDPGRVAAARL